MSERPKFDPTKIEVEHVSQYGHVSPARVISTDLAGDCPIVAAVMHATGNEWLVTAKTDGSEANGGHLRNRMVKREGWVRVASPIRSISRPIVAGSGIYETQADAEEWPGVLVARIEWEEPA